MKFFDVNKVDVEYLNLVDKVLRYGTKKDDRTGTGTISLFGPQMEFDLRDGFPILTTKRVPFRLIASELLWFIKGDTNLKTLLEQNNHIWDDDAYRFYLENGGDLDQETFNEKVLNSEEGFDLGPIYGAQWRTWKDVDGKVIDQLAAAINQVKNDPDSRRIVVSAWAPHDIPGMALPPCHILFQLYVENNKYLSLKMYQR